MDDGFSSVLKILAALRCKENGARKLCSDSAHGTVILWLASSSEEVMEVRLSMDEVVMFCGAQSSKPLDLHDWWEGRLQKSRMVLRMMGTMKTARTALRKSSVKLRAVRRAFAGTYITI